MPISPEKFNELLLNGCLREQIDINERRGMTDEEGGRNLLYGDPSVCPYGRAFGCGKKTRKMCIPHQGAFQGFLSLVGKVFDQVPFPGKPPDPIVEITQVLTSRLPKAGRKKGMIKVVTTDFKPQEMPIREAATAVLDLAEMSEQHLMERREINLKARR